MIRIASVIGLNVLGMAVATWGLTMLLGTHTPFVPVAVTAITSSGLGLIAVSTALLVESVLVGGNRPGSSRQIEELPPETPAPTPVHNRSRLAESMEDLHRATLDLVERKREVYYLNLHQWHHDHREETSAEIDANKRYRHAKNALELERLSLPTQFWMPVDGFCEALEDTLAREVYSPPKDKRVYESMNRLWHSTLRELNDVAMQIPSAREVYSPIN